MAIELGDAVIKFLADTSGLDRATESETKLAQAAAKVAQASAPAAAAVDKLGNEAQRAQDPVQELRGHIDQLTKSLGTAGNVRIPPVLAQLGQKGGGGIASAFLTEFGSQMTSMASGMLAADSVTKTIDFLKGVVSDSVTEADEFARAFREVAVVLSGSGQDVESYRQYVHGLSTELGTSAELARGMATALKGTGRDEAGGKSVLEASARLSKTHGLDLVGTVKGVNDILGAYGDTATNASRYTDMLAVAFQGCDDFGKDFLDSIGKLLPLAQRMGMPFEDLTAVLGAMTNSGLSVQQSVAGLGQLMKAATKPSADMAEALDALQRSGRGLNVAFGVEGVRAAGGFLPWLQKLSAAIKDDETAMTLFMGGTRQAAAAASLFAGDMGAVVAKSRELADSQRNAAESQRMLAEKSRTVSEQAARSYQILTKELSGALGPMENIAGLWQQFNNGLEAGIGLVPRMIPLLREFKIVADGIKLAGLLGGGDKGGAPKQTMEEYLQRWVRTGGTKPVKEPDSAQIVSPEKLLLLLDKRKKLVQEFADMESKATQDYKDQPDMLQRALGAIDQLRKGKLAEYDEEQRQKAQRKADQAEDRANRAQDAAERLAALREQAAAARESYQMMVADPNSDFYEQNIRGFQEWKEKTVALNKALRDARQAEVEWASDPAMEQHLTAQQRAIDEKVKAILRMNRSVRLEQDPIRQYTAPRTDMSLYGQPYDVNRLANALKALGIQSSSSYKLAADSAQEAAAEIEEANRLGLASTQDVLRAERVAIQARIDMYKAMGVEIPAALQRQLERTEEVLSQYGVASGKAFNITESLAQRFEKTPKTVGKAVDAIGMSMDQMVGGMQQGMEGVLQAWIMGEGSLGDLLKSMLAQQMAQAAARLGVLAIECMAYGFYYLATMQWAAAGQAFASAGMIGGMAAGLGFGARAINPNRGGSESGSSQPDYQRQDPNPVRGGLGSGLSDPSQQLGVLAAAASRASIQSGQARQERVVAVTIHAVDARSFQQLVRDNPSAIIDVAVGDINRSGRLRRATASRSPV